MFNIAANPQGPGPGQILIGFNDWNAFRYIAAQQVSAAQSFKVPNEQTIDNLRQSRLTLLKVSIMLSRDLSSQNPGH